MNKLLMGAAACALILSGCAENELIEGSNPVSNDGRVRFGASTKLMTRAATDNPVATEELQKLGTFYVAGFSNAIQLVGTSGTPQQVTWNKTSWEYGNEPYWPNGTMNFYAYANWETAPKLDSTGIAATDVTIGQDAATPHKDFLVAAVTASKQLRTLLTFKHALTQIVFKAGNINPTNIEVEIGGISLVNVSEKGTMHYSLEGLDAGKIVWSNQAKHVTDPSYVVNHINNTPGSGYTVISLLSSATDYSKYPRVQTAANLINNALMLIPQTFSAWDPTNGQASVQTGAYIKLQAIVKKPGSDEPAFYYCGTPGGATGFAGDTYGTIYIPVSSVEGQLAEWKPGKRINYIITFGDSNSGSGGGGYDEDGKPVLLPIRFQAEVEDWVESEAPLLTATFEATSSVIDGLFVAGYIRQLLNDIQSASVPKVYTGKITIKGSLKSDASSQDVLAGINFDWKINNQFLEGSTIELNFTGVTNWNGKELTLTVPTGWKAGAMSTGEVVTLNGTTNTVILTRLN